MPLNFLNRLNEERPKNKRHDDFEKVKTVVLSVKNLGQFGTAKEMVNNFLKTYKLGKDSPESIYFKRILHIKRMGINGNIEEGLDDEGSLMKNIREIALRKLNESLNWSDKDETFSSDDNWSTDPNWSTDDNWKTDTNWVQGSTGPGTSETDTEEPMTEGDEIDDFDWVRNQKPISREEIKSELESTDAYVYSTYLDELVESIYNIGLTDQLYKDLINSMVQVMDSIHEDSYDSGVSDCDCSDDWSSGHSEGYDEGYDNGREAGYEDGQAECPECPEE